MRLQELTATPHPAGNRIVVRWKNPDPQGYPNIRVVRRERTYPETPEDGTAVQVQPGKEIADDLTGLRGETTYYYTLFPYKGNPPEYDTQHQAYNRVAAMATKPYNLAGQMYDLLPGIYHRYDVDLPDDPPGDMPAEDRQRGQLRRFLDLPGGQLDQLYSFATALLNLHNPNQVDGRLLPLLAEWIGWQTNYKLEPAQQRNEIQYAPYLYQTIGIIPTLEATVKRLYGWECKTKEFFNNVFRSNCPEKLNIWLCKRDNNGRWAEPDGVDLPPNLVCKNRLAVALSPQELEQQLTVPLSLDFAYEGRPSAVRDGSGRIWLFYHTLKNDRWEIWYKIYTLKKGWTASKPLASGNAIGRHPTAVFQGTKLWVFWDCFFEAEQCYRINFCTFDDKGWSPVTTLDLNTVDTTGCFQPAATRDSYGGLWLFCIKREGSQFQLKYAHYDGVHWSVGSDFRGDDGEYVRVECDLFVLVDTTSSIWVFWAYQELSRDDNQKYWRIAYRIKRSIDPRQSDWGTVCTISCEELKDDREPVVRDGERGEIEVFWSSNRGGNWSIWEGMFTSTSGALKPFQRITGGEYSQRAPFCINTSDNSTFLLYRSNESLIYSSQVYGATKTLDFRYAGSTTVDTRNYAKTALREKLEDFQTYTYSFKLPEEPTPTSKAKRVKVQDCYNRETVGIYLHLDTKDKDLNQDLEFILNNENLYKNALYPFLSLQVNLAFLPAISPTQEPSIYSNLATMDGSLPGIGSSLLFSDM